MVRLILCLIVVLYTTQIFCQKEKLPEFDLPGLEKLIDAPNQIISFWASWCAPCMEELPYFAQLKQDYPEIKIMLINLDAPKAISTKVIPIISNKRYSGIQFGRILSSLAADDWMPIMHPDWDGGIPASVFQTGTETKFMSGKFPAYSNLVEFIHLTK